ncbi:MAG: hypothetical protein M0Z41_16020 [Peptococcaceae bacterium]|jgi:hypothetical protein|nr:hypothetical protein [Peptococcaceae bacterium]
MSESTMTARPPIPIAVRVHTKLVRELPNSNKGFFKLKEDLRPAYGKRVMVFDTETTIDELQNLNFGQAYIYEGETQAHINGEVKEKYIFFGEGLSEKDLETLKQYAFIKGLTILSRQEYIDKVFWPEVWEYGTLCVGFNLPFDLSRLAISVKTFSKGKHKEKFEFKFSDSTYKPTILLKPIDSKKAFVELRFPTRPKRQSKRIPFAPGRFLDLRTLVFALTNESHSLESAGRLYGVDHGKQASVEHGKITPEYLDYNNQDILATWDLYCRAKTEFDQHPIDLEAGKAYSPATIGKAYYRAMGILPFAEKQAGFSLDIMGYTMTAYYGGRAECHYRNTPVKVFHTDVTSMYPSVFTLQNLWHWVIAKMLDVEEATAEIRSFVDGITLESLLDKEIWRDVPGLVLVKPDHDLLPIRAEYAKDNGYQIGLNYLTVPEDVLKETGSGGLWYTLADVISAKILSGKTPAILKAYRIIPRGKQDGLTDVKLRGEIDVQPRLDNFFKRVIEKRKEVKKQVKQDGDNNDALQTFLKILANSTSYGVYIEMNREELRENDSVEVFGLNHFKPEEDEEFEKTGRFYNPLIAVMITGAARLILAMMERTTKDLNGNFAFCDTDSMAVIDLVNDQPEIIGCQLVERFRGLLPYDRPPFGEDDGLLDAEDYNWGRVDWTKDTDKGNIKKGEYYPLYCYAVSAKRYVLYNLLPNGNGGNKIVIRKKSDHGLGHLSPPIPKDTKNVWVNDVWKYIISREHTIPYDEPRWFYLPAFAQMSISKPSVYNLVNRDKDISYTKQIKPSNFILVAYPQGWLWNKSSVNRYYCRLHKGIGLGLCDNKGRCEYSKECYANLHIIPIAPYSRGFGNWQDFNWIDKATKQPVNLRLSDTHTEQYKKIEATKIAEECMAKFHNYLEGTEREEKLDNLIGGIIIDSENNKFNDSAILTDDVTIKNYLDFILPYASHAELKYDGLGGEVCGNNTKGLLQRTHVIVKSIKHIGKETNTIQDIEEQNILPDETKLEDWTKEYQPIQQKPARECRIDEKQWVNLLPVLKEKAKPRKAWAEKLEITDRHFKRLISLNEFPSPDLYRRIIEQCKAERISIPDGKKPMPKRFEDSSYLISRLEDITACRINLKEFTERFSGDIFTLYGRKYIKETPDVLVYAEHCNILKQKADEAEKVKAIQELEIAGLNLKLPGQPEVMFNPESICEFAAAHKVGKSYKTLNVKLMDGRIMAVSRKENELAFKLGLLPMPSRVFDEWLKKKKITSRNTNGYITKYTPFIPYCQNPPISLSSVAKHYGLKISKIKMDLANGVFANNAVCEENGKIFINGLAAWLQYGKGQR